MAKKFERSVSLGGSNKRYPCGLSLGVNRGSSFDGFSELQSICSTCNNDGSLSPDDEDPKLLGLCDMSTLNTQ